MYVGPSEPLFDTSPINCQISDHKSADLQGKDQPNRKDRPDCLQRVNTGTDKEGGQPAKLARTLQLTDLPYEMVHRIADRLDVRSIAALSQTSHYLNGAVHDMAVDKMASHYYGPPGSAARRRYDRLYTPLARRLWPGREFNNDTVPLAEEQQERQRLHQITRLRTLSHSGKLYPTCKTFEEAGCFEPLTFGLSRLWGACALIRCKPLSHDLADREPLSLVVMDPSPSLIDVSPVKQLHPYHIDSAQIVPDGHIVTAGTATPPADKECHFILTVYQHDNQTGAIQQVVLPGTHNDRIVRVGQLPDGRIVSASRDHTLKIRPLDPPDERRVITLTGHRDKITDMLILAGSRCITSSYDHTLKLWDLSQPSKESCVATLTDMPRIICKLQPLTEDRFLSESCPNVILIWQLTDSGASPTAMLDPDWPIRLSPDETTTGREAAYELLTQPIPHPSLGQYMFRVEVLPDGRITLHHWSGIRLCDPSAPHSKTQRLCILARNDSGAVIRTLPICPVGPSLTPLVTHFHSVHQLPDGRMVHADTDGTLHFYSFGNHSTTSHVIQDNLYSILPQRSYLSFEWIIVMNDGRLFLSTQLKGPKALFLLYDPYALPKSSHNPGQED